MAHEIVSGVSEHRSPEFLDRVGTWVSAACAVHCMAMPFALTALPFLGLGFLAHGMFDVVMIGLAVTIALASLCWGHRIHGSFKTFLFVAAAVSFFALGHVFEDSSLHWLLMAAGGTSLVAGHVLNRRLCKACSSCAQDH